MIGTSLGPYKIIELLGKGGMGEVYLGEDTRLGRKVAIKVLPEDLAADGDREVTHWDAVQSAVSYSPASSIASISFPSATLRASIPALPPCE